MLLDEYVPVIAIAIIVWGSYDMYGEFTTVA